MERSNDNQKQSDTGSAPPQQLASPVNAAAQPLPVIANPLADHNANLESPARIEAATRLQALWRGRQVRQQVRVQREAPGIIGTRIRAPGASVAPDTPLAAIQGRMQPGSRYDRLTVLGGADAGGVFGTANGEAPEQPATLAQQAPSGSAVINGGYFVHKDGLRDSDNQPIHGTGRPVGPTSTRDDNVPVPAPWQDDYGQLNVGGQVGLSAGPLLALDGQRRDLPDDDRFKYRVGHDSHENPLNNRAGALTHASDRNERAAISIGESGGRRDVVMHTLTSGEPPNLNPGQRRNLGATMESWQGITEQATSGHQNVSTLNLDGGGSVYMGIRQGGGVRPISRGGPPDQDVRPVANVIASKPTID